MKSNDQNDKKTKEQKEDILLDSVLQDITKILKKANEPRKPDDPYFGQDPLYEEVEKKIVRCSICGKGFRRFVTLMDHITRQHPVTWERLRGLLASEQTDEWIERMAKEIENDANNK